CGGNGVRAGPSESFIPKDTLRGFQYGFSGRRAVVMARVASCEPVRTPLWHLTNQIVKLQHDSTVVKWGHFWVVGQFEQSLQLNAAGFFEIYPGRMPFSGRPTSQAESRTRNP